MARGKHLSIEEARKPGELDQFTKENPSEGDEEAFDQLFNGMETRGNNTHYLILP